MMIFPLEYVDSSNVQDVGGKAVNLGELVQAGFNVPPGFCVGTQAFYIFVNKARQDIYARLEKVKQEDMDTLRSIGTEVRAHLQEIPLPQEISDQVLKAWREYGEMHAYAIRSSATAEDLPNASFAGQHDTYLNILGGKSILDKVKACFISLFTDRAILYRIQNGFDHRKVALAIVIQRMVQPEVSGVLFTADPVCGNRNLISVELLEENPDSPEGNP